MQRMEAWYRTRLEHIENQERTVNHRDLEEAQRFVRDAIPDSSEAGLKRILLQIVRLVVPLAARQVSTANQPLLEAASDNIEFTGSLEETVLAWAEENLADRVTKMSLVSQKRLANTLADGLRSNASVPEMGKLIRKEFADMSIYRSEMIALTETADALGWAAADQAVSMRLEKKEWITSPAETVCDICEPNMAQGRIGMGTQFSSGHQRPPAHPNCHCVVVYTKF
jgi:hypothetical protein